MKKSNKQTKNCDSNEHNAINTTGKHFSARVRKPTCVIFSKKSLVHKNCLIQENSENPLFGRIEDENTRKLKAIADACTFLSNCYEFGQIQNRISSLGASNLELQHSYKNGGNSSLQQNSIGNENFSSGTIEPHEIKPAAVIKVNLTSQKGDTLKIENDSNSPTHSQSDINSHTSLLNEKVNQHSKLEKNTKANTLIVNETQRVEEVADNVEFLQNTVSLLGLGQYRMLDADSSFDIDAKRFKGAIPETLKQLNEHNFAPIKIANLASAIHCKLDSKKMQSSDKYFFSPSDLKMRLPNYLTSTSKAMSDSHLSKSQKASSLQRDFVSLNTAEASENSEMVSAFIDNPYVEVPELNVDSIIQSYREVTAVSLELSSDGDLDISVNKTDKVNPYQVQENSSNPLTIQTQNFDFSIPGSTRDACQNNLIHPNLKLENKNVDTYVMKVDPTLDEHTKIRLNKPNLPKVAGSLRKLSKINKLALRIKKESTKNPGSDEKEVKIALNEVVLRSTLVKDVDPQPEQPSTVPEQINETKPKKIYRSNIKRTRSEGSNVEIMQPFDHYKDLIIKESHIHGLGIFTPVDIKKDTLIMEYKGEVIGKCMSDKRENYYRSNNIDSIYMFTVSDDMIIDATMTGNKARYINHSCNPNCQSITSMSDRSIKYCSVRDILPGEELTINYYMSMDDSDDICMCGDENCKSKQIRDSNR